MSFTLANWTCVSASLSEPQEAVNIFGTVGNTTLNAPNLYMYGSPTDTAATIEASNYFLSLWPSLGVGDWIMGFGTDTSFILQVTAVSSTSVTTETVGFSASVGTANILNNAVTFAKFQQVAAVSLVGNPTGSLANVQGITLGNGLSFSGTTLQLSPSFNSQAIVPMTLAQWNGMYAAPFLLLAAPGAGLMNIVESVYINLIYGSAALANGGAVSAQYGNTVHAGGTLITNAEAAADFIAASANTMFKLSGTLGTGVLTSAGINVGVYLSNATAPFITGTGDTFNVIVNYRTVSAT
jgi:hypothetical protein